MHRSDVFRLAKTFRLDLNTGFRRYVRYLYDAACFDLPVL